MGMSRANETLGAHLSTLAKRPYLEKLISQYSARYKLPRAVVADAVQQSFYKILKTYAGRTSDLQTLEQVERFLHTVIRNTLIDEIRRSDVVKFVELDEDYLELMRSSRGLDEPEAGEPDTQALEPEEEEAETSPDESETPETKAAVLTTPLLRISTNLEDTLIDEIDSQALIRTVLKQLDPKYREVVVLLLVEWTPKEVSQKFGQNGYRLIMWARVKMCRILAPLAAAGHEIAQRLHADGGCHRLLQSIRGGGAAATA
jgi:RNA polymerase sigma factor (sigma-70 family)